jgi:hypothetical protein
MGRLREFLAGRFALLLTAVAWLWPACAGAEFIRGTMPQISGEKIAVDAEAMVAYVINAAANRLYYYNANAPIPGEIRQVTVGRNPRYIALDRFAVYVGNADDGTLTVARNHSLEIAATLPIGGFGPIVVDSRRDKVYVVRLTGGVVVVDPQTLAWRVIDTPGAPPTDLAVDPDTGRLFVTSAGANLMIVFDPATGYPISSVRIQGEPGPIAWSNGGVFVLTQNSRASIVFVDPRTMATRTVSVPGFGFLASALVATSSNVYAGFAEGIVVLDTKTFNVTTVRTGVVRSLFADHLGGQAFAVDTERTLTVIRGQDKSITRTVLPHDVSGVAFIYKGNSALATGSALSNVNAPSSEFGVSGVNAQGLWWALGGAESGWGINISHQGQKVFATWFTYDAQGRNTWLVMSDGRDAGRNSYEGTLYRTTGPAFGAAFDPVSVTRTPVGTLRIDIRNSDNASMTATVDGVTVRKEISKQQYAVPMPTCFQDGVKGSIPNYQDLWWKSPAESESGWGLNIAHQGDILFITWFTYDGSGQPMWLVGSSIGKKGNATYAGTLYRTSGPSLTASPWDPARVSRMPAGSATLTFGDADNGMFEYSVDGVGQAKTITRQVFSSPASVCR